jgi:ribosome-associated protein
MRDVVLRDPEIRLGQLLKFAGIADTGGEAKQLLVDGEVQVNGEPESRRGRTIRPGDVVTALGDEVRVAGPGGP